MFVLIHVVKEFSFVRISRRVSKRIRVRSDFMDGRMRDVIRR